MLRSRLHNVEQQSGHSGAVEGNAVLWHLVRLRLDQAVSLGSVGEPLVVPLHPFDKAPFPQDLLGVEVDKAQLVEAIYDEEQNQP